MSSVLTVYIGPLYKLWSFVLLSAKRALDRFALPSSNPLMETPVTNILPLPSIVSVVRDFHSLGLSPLYRSFVSLNKPSLFVSHGLYYSYKFGNIQL